MNICLWLPSSLLKTNTNRNKIRHSTNLLTSHFITVDNAILWNVKNVLKERLCCLYSYIFRQLAKGYTNAIECFVAYRGCFFHSVLPGFGNLPKKLLKKKLFIMKLWINNHFGIVLIQPKVPNWSGIFGLCCYLCCLTWNLRTLQRNLSPKIVSRNRYSKSWKSPILCSERKKSFNKAELHLWTIRECYA